MFYNFTIEVRNRVFLIGFTWLSGFCAAYVYKNTLLFSVIKRNLTTDYFITTDIAEAFLTYFKLNLSLANCFFIIYCCYHSTVFFVSALYYVEYIFFVSILSVSSINLIFLVLFVYYIGIPVTWELFTKAQTAVYSQIVPIYFENKLYELLDFYLSFFRFSVLSSFLSTILILSSVQINENLTALKRNRGAFHFSLITIIILLSPLDLFGFLFASLIFITIFELSILLNSLKI